MAVETTIFAFLGIGLIFIFFWFLFIVAVIAGFVFWIFMLIDVAKRNFKEQNEKIVWILVVALVGIIGALIYYFVVKKKANQFEKPKA